MTDREQQQERMREAVDRKREEAQAKAQQQQVEADDRPQDEQSPRAKSSRHGKVTAENWNQ